MNVLQNQYLTMKILPIEKVREADSFTIAQEPIASINLMERAASQCFEWIVRRVSTEKKIFVFAGPGNNGGDGLVIARLLAGKGYHVEAFVVRFTEKQSADFARNLERLKNIKKIKVLDIREGGHFSMSAENAVIIDAIFGSGLSKPVLGWVADIIEEINKLKAEVVAVDMPSGLFADKTSKEKEGAIIQADYTLSFQFPKYAFFFSENDSYIGNWTILPIGLHADFISQVEVKNYYLQYNDVSILIKPRNKFAHKGVFGHGLLISGSYGKMGAAVLGTRAALRSGAGLITTHIPQIGYPILQTAVPEGMVSIDESEREFSSLPDISNYNAIAIGPGIGLEPQTQNALKLLIQNSSRPLIFDADAINILGENKTWISFVPAGSIFTPHPREFQRMVGSWRDEFERNDMQREFSFKFQSYVILKGAYTAITTPRGDCYFNSTGNPGMATAGSGDVLTGILLGLLAQNYTPLQTCLLGVYLHGLAGDLAAKKLSPQSLVADDIINYLGKAFRKLQK